MINGLVINPYVPAPPSVTVPGNSTPFTNFELQDKISVTVQRWTYTAKLYRDGALVEQLAGKSRLFKPKGISAKFTGQPNSFVHGHQWKIEWHYAGPNHGNGSISFFIP